MLYGVILTVSCYEIYRYYCKPAYGNCSSELDISNGQKNKDDIHAHCKEKIAAERIGRINAEKSIRAGVVEKISDPSIGYPLLVIGNIESPYLARRGTPRQGLLVPDSRSLIRLSKEIPPETLQGLEGYSHMFVQFLFHENTNLAKTLLNSGGVSSRSSASKSSTFSKRVNSFAAKVLPPLLNGDSIGVFASRSPHRPNALGLSLVKIIKVDVAGRTILVGGADLVNGTPVVDLKPWGPFDCPTCLHNTVDHSGIVKCADVGDRCKSFNTLIPNWVEYGLAHPYILPVEWKPDVVPILVDAVDSDKCLFYRKGESQALIRAVEQMLGLDIRSVHRGRGKGAEVPKGVATELIGDRLRGSQDKGGQAYEVQFDILHIEFRVHNGGHEIHRSQPWISIDSIKFGQ